MLLSSFLTLLVLSTLRSPKENKRDSDKKMMKSSEMGQMMWMNRLGMLVLSYVLMLMLNTMNMMTLMPGLTLLNNWLNVTSYNVPMMMLMLLLMMGLLMYNANMWYKKKEWKLLSRYYMMLMMGNSMGLLLFPLVNDLLALYMMMELQSYSLYLLTGLHNRSYNGSRASLLYFLMGGMASGMILLSMYFMYSLTGSTNLLDMSMMKKLLLLSNNNMNMNTYFDMLLMALLFKMGLAPLHRWSMGVYNYAPTYMTAYMSMVAKMSMSSWMFTNSMLFNNNLLIMFFYLSLLMGSYKPLYQMNMKTMLAYSGLLNFGYMMLSMMTFDMSFYMYMMQYTLTHMMMFLSMLAASEYINKPVSMWSPLIYIHQLKLPNLTLAMCMMLALFSLMGMPPLPGFYGKLYILMSALQDNYMLESLILIMCSVMATYYYANIMKMLMTSKTIKENMSNGNNNINLSLAYVIATATMLLISFFMFLPFISEGLYLMTI
uniref:NADH-ubiquinone oxidoreductase chain 2 n=1 Tax=Metschnikowia cubensis TaxID=1323754 RepID=A0A7D7CZ02_9ASCO|nr:Nad2 [Metschnikowia cubensis]YP_009918717.1 Nad2 [Metschnikowia cubensis]QMJ95773.1 Nad2 [Metschnikowia cubensis]QMJ95788.1 Nad2 [Metschnikowia cubensis]QMJ95789.1 Nad2 [Metschnikowia cubensis]QMJ95804.1 Nad2 [Metschnikowia cubensis]